MNLSKLINVNIKHPARIMLTIPIYVNILFIHFGIQLANFDLLHIYFDLLIFHVTYVFKPFTLLFWHEPCENFCQLSDIRLCIDLRITMQS